MIDRLLLERFQNSEARYEAQFELRQRPVSNLLGRPASSKFEELYL